MLSVKPRPSLAVSASNAPEIVASVRGLRKRFGKASVLEDINFDVAEGELLVLLGASGSGKTTILRIIAGLDQPETGRVILHGKDVTDLPARQRGVGVIFQSYALFPQMTVEKNISYGLRIRGRKRTEIRENVDRLLELVQLQAHRRKYPSQLSGGQQQRVAIARTLAYQPEVLLFDEPFGALDAHTRGHLRREIRALLKQVNVPAIFITHDQEEALELGDRIAVLNSGHIEQIGPPQELYNHPTSEYVASFLGAANFLPGVIRRGHVEVGSGVMPLGIEAGIFCEAQAVKLFFRPEDVRLSQIGFFSEGYYHLSTGTIEELNFVGAYERLRIRSEPGSEVAQPIIATRAKAEAIATKLRVGDQVDIALISFRVMPTGTTASDSVGPGRDFATPEGDQSRFSVEGLGASVPDGVHRLVTKAITEASTL